MKKFLTNILYIVLCFVISYFAVIGYSKLTSGSKTRNVKIKEIPIKNKYVITYKDGTHYTVNANSYIWNGDKIKFLVNDTTVVNETPSSTVESVDIKK